MTVKGISMLGVTGLVIGNLVGAGILALPISLGLVGIVPAIISMTVYTLMMYFTAVVISDEASEAKQELFDYPSLYEKYLGKIGKWIAIVTNAIILYGVLVAYISGGTQILADALGFGTDTVSIAIIFSIILVSLTVFDLSIINKYNTVLIFILFFTFIMMIVYTLPKVDISHFEVSHYECFGLTIPLVVIAAHFHNIIPRLCADVNWNTKSLKKAMFWGMLAAFAMNLMWTICGIGCLNYNGENSIVSSYINNMPATVPMGIILKSNLFLVLGVTFSIIAITTSFFANGAGLQNFIKDLMFNIVNCKKMWLVRLITFVPPVVIAILWPQIFIKALNVSSGIGIVTLFGILPSIIAIKKKDNTKLMRIFGGVFLVLSILALISSVGIIFHIKGFYPNF